jgi:class 3 adenylate cyclase/tetratricopeptide (TPR) repeat protein
MDVAGWLRSLGLDRYESAFRENEVDETVLPSLTPEDLKDLGVVLVGHRRKLLDAIAALHRDTMAKPSVSDAIPITSAPQTDSAERRHVTVMFSDLVGSTALSARMDPEDLREVISAYQKSVTEAVGRWGGFIAKYLGDGVLVYFGYPQAHEDDAERAARAGLDLIAAVAALKTHTPLQTRVGVATGLVVVGDLIGSGEAQERGIVGETPNLAARLQGVAEPNMLVIGESTRRLIGNLFDLDDLGPQTLKGIDGPVRAFAVLRASLMESRFEALRSGRLTALVGREEEFELLVRRWSKTRTGTGQVVLLSGEGGIGKSRLTAALLEQLAADKHTRLRYFCSPHHADSAFHPIIGQMERAAGLHHDDTPKSRLDKLDALLARTSTSISDSALFAEMLSLPNDGRYPVIDLSPQQRRQKTLQALSSQIEALTRSNPVLMIFEDAHWSDPTSLESIGQVIDAIRGLPVLTIVTFRPEFSPPWIGHSHVTSLTLNRLGEREVTGIIERLAGNRRLPPDVAAEIVERTDGIPLFVEELTKAVLEAATDVAARSTVAAVPSPALSVPATLHASLMARLDRLGSAKEIAQIGAAIGREFSYALMASVAHRSEAELGAALDRLSQAGLISRHGVPPQATYLFNQALVQDAAYGTLLREPRRLLHARIAETLENEFAELAESRPESLARHYAEAGFIEKAAMLWGRAGERSLARSALVEATIQLDRALNLIASLPATPILRREQIKLQVAIITPLIHVKGYAAPETKAAVEQARVLIEQAEASGDPPEDRLLLFSVLYGFWVANFVAFDGPVINDLAAQFLALAEKQGGTVPLMVGHRLIGTSLLYTGDIAKGRGHYDQALAFYDTASHRPLAARFGQDVRVAILSYRSLALWLLGHPDAALGDVNEAINNARQIGEAATLMYALAHAAMQQTFCGNYTIANTQAQELAALAQEKDSLLWKAFAMMNQGSVLALSGVPSEAVQALTTGMNSWQSTGSTLWTPLRLSYLAVAYARLGQMDDAWRSIAEAMNVVEASNERWCQPEILRVSGELARKSDTAKAEALFDRALMTAREHQAKSWELRAAISMARLSCEQGDDQRGRDLLAPIFDGFHEGFETGDLKMAKSLLVEMAG